MWYVNSTYSELFEPHCYVEPHEVLTTSVTLNVLYGHFDNIWLFLMLPFVTLFSLCYITVAGKNYLLYFELT